MSTTHYLTQPRKPKGTPVGGRWTDRELGDAEVSLVSRHRQFLMARPEVKQVIDERRQQLQEQGFVPARMMRSAASPDTTANIDQWWDNQFLGAELSTADKAVPHMPQDYTPKRTAGQAVTGKRRTHRMRYQVAAGVELRMPSKTSIRSFMAESGADTIDVPVAAGAPGAPAVQGWVRLTHLGGGRYSAEGLGMTGKTEMMVAESVAATMEGRSAQLSLNSYADMVARRQDRERAYGVAPTEVNSSWINNVAYNEAEGIMYSRLAHGGTYGHLVPKSVFDKLRNAPSPGAVFNREVKGNNRSVAGVEQCDECGRFTAPAVQHICPKTEVESEALRSNMVTASYLGVDDIIKPAATAASTTAAGDVAHKVDPGEQTVDIDRLWHEAAEGASPRRRAVYGPTGFTLEAANVLAPNTSSTYVPHAYVTLGDYERRNDGDLVKFNGVQAGQVEKLKGMLPESVMSERQNFGPTARALIEAASANPGEVELNGYLVNPSRDDERVTFEGLDIYDDEAVQHFAEILEDAPPNYPQGEEDREQWQADYDEHQKRLKEAYLPLAERYGLDATEAPDEVSIQENPWRPGEQSIHMWWD